MKTKPLIIGINGSPRKRGHTFNLLCQVLNSVKKHGGKTEIIHLADKNIKSCLGCYSTNSKLCQLPCRIKDDMQEIHKLLEEAEGIVFASPVYWFNISGLMKNFLDRLTCLEYSPKESDSFVLEGKVVGLVVSGEEAGMTSALSAMLNFALHQGMVVPPYPMVYSFSEEKKNLKWNKIDLGLLGKNILTMIKAQKYLEKKCPQNWPYPWDYKCQP